jgi:hypothetical protein
MSMVDPKTDDEAEVMNPAEQQAAGSGEALGRSQPLRSEDPGPTSAVDPAVLRDIRHSIGNRFHKLYYWAELLGGTTDPEKRAEQIQGLVDGMRGLQDEVEASLRYCQPESCAPMTMPLEDLIEAVDRLLGSELPGVDIDVLPLAGTRPIEVWLDPQLFSQALRSVLGLLGGTRCESLTCRFEADPAGNHLEIWIATLGKERNEEAEGSLLEWALAAKALHTQGGGLRPIGAGPSTVEGCVFALALRN